MILVDTSAFIEYYRPGGDEQVRAAVAEAVAADGVATNGIIYVEIVAFAADSGDHERLVADFGSFHWLETGRRECDRAGEIGFALRRRGLTIPPTDLIVAATALEAGADLYHVDAHYDLVAEHTDLKARHLRS